MSFLPDTSLILNSLGWAVLHSLWQGALAAFLVWALRATIRESAADTRYMVSFITLCALFTAFIGTFLYYYGAGTGVGGVSIDAVLSQTINITAPATESTGAANPLTQITNYTANIGALWALGFAVLGARYLAAFRLTHKLRTTGLSDLPSNWQTRFAALAGKSGVGGKVRGYISEHVSSPITFGFWRPIVLVPAWFFTGMSAEQCEAVLLHEFAHIRRHDYLTNILQIIIKTVFFYHPAVQYICKSINTDREHACDDFAAMMSKNPESLATALGTIRLKSARSGGVFALAADGRDAPLMHRLKRLMGTPSKTMRTGSTRSTAAAIMVVAACASLLTLGASDSLAHPHKSDPEVLAGAATTNLEAWGSPVDDKITVKGTTYTATTFEYAKDSNGHDVINGKSYHPIGNAYSVYAKDGKSYVVKQKNGKRYMEIGDNWYRVDADSATGSSAMPTPPKYAYSYEKIEGEKYKTKTNLEKNQTFIKINDRWYDIDEANLDRLIPASVTPTVKPTTYSYGYAVKDGNTYKVKTKGGKSYIKIDDKWRKAAMSGGGDHGHTHVKIDDGWYSVKTSKNIDTIINTQVHNNIEDTLAREGFTTAVAANGTTYVRSGGVKIITDKDGNTDIDFSDDKTEAVKSGYTYGYITKSDKTHLVKTEQKSGKSYAQFGNTWVHVKNKWQEGQRSPSKIKINGKWYALNDTVLASAPAPPTPPSKNYWISDQEREATMARAESARERASEARERAEEQREAAFERAEEQRERAMERAWEHATEQQHEQASEWSEEQAELAADMAELAQELAEDKIELTREYKQEQAKLRAELGRMSGERAREQHVRNMEQHTRNYEQHLRNHEQQVRNAEQRIRDNEQRARDREQKLRDRQHKMAEKNRIKADKQRVSYEEMRDRLIPALKADGYLSGNSKTVKMEMTPEDIYINGKLLPSAREGIYCKIVSDYGMRKDDMKTIIIKPNSFQVSAEGDNGNHRITIGTFEHDKH